MLTTSTGLLGHDSVGGLGLLLVQHCSVFHADPFATVFGVPHNTHDSTSTGIAQLGACIMGTCPTNYCSETQEPNHGCQVKTEEMGEQGVPVRHYHGHEHFLGERSSHGAGNGSPDADEGEL
jgi:hypothetical protein